MEITTRLKQRFCKDCGVPINIFHEPYFSDRLKLFDQFYDTIERWDVFCDELKKYNNEEEYFVEYNKVKDEAIDFIKNTEGYKRFNEMNMNDFAVDTHGISSKDIYHPSNDRKHFISIDMKEANYSALKFFSADIFDYKSTWRKFLEEFTNNEHILNSKYIRQVILGNCNPKRHITYEKYLMSKILEKLLMKVSRERIIFFSNDEIVIDLTNIDDSEYLEFVACSFYDIKPIFSTHCCNFVLKRIYGIDGYVKVTPDEDKIIREIKCVNPYILPFVLRKVLGQEVTESDKVFYHDGLLAKFIEVPEIVI